MKNLTTFVALVLFMITGFICLKQAHDVFALENELTYERASNNLLNRDLNKLQIQYHFASDKLADCTEDNESLNERLTVVERDLALMQVQREIETKKLTNKLTWFVAYKEKQDRWIDQYKQWRDHAKFPHSEKCGLPSGLCK